MNGERVVYLPSTDFLDACKLKLKDAAPEGYEGVYQESKGEAVAVNFSSIAMVCAKATKSETVYGILRDIFAKIIENPKDRALNIELKNLGYLSFSPSAPGYLTFSEKKELPLEQVEKKELTTDNVEQLSTMIDTISNKLSTGGPCLSVRSGFLTNLSVKTPSHASKVQSSTSVTRKADYWVDYRRRFRKKQLMDTDSIFETKSYSSA